MYVCLRVYWVERDARFDEHVARCNIMTLAHYVVDVLRRHTGGLRRQGCCAHTMYRLCLVEAVACDLACYYDCFGFTFLCSAAFRHELNHAKFANRFGGIMA